MKSQTLKAIMCKAQEICARSGGRLTEKRKCILKILLVSDTALSAYDVAAAYNKGADLPMPTMSIYRILDFLVSEQLVHKLSSENKYVACAHIRCQHAHELAQFLICGSCQSVKEIVISKSIIEELGQQVLQAGYKLINSQLELQCLCVNCESRAA